ncbi:zinc finger protein ZFP2 isoform X1 [Drosophila sulfurigaster albostrigata]|uniref:zinc finger protein ZFP2 isoform X1 n=1 Tax=Drosophila sulfurigaster albostrigata TaxID=89887 RepID=UPI002D21BD02|nr:zinc finger protein ZFP2 isoform X1 [Drosophila sulfurigaster albostrigata]
METCRTCAKCDFENGNNNYWLDLFHPARWQSEMAQIRMEFVNWKLQIAPNDGLPQKICSDCFTKFCSIYTFRMACQDAQLKLSNIFDKIDANLLYDKTDDEQHVDDEHNDANVIEDAAITETTTATQNTAIIEAKASTPIEIYVETININETTTNSETATETLQLEEEGVDDFSTDFNSLNISFACKFCYKPEESYELQHLLLEHISSAHDPDQPYNCPECTECFQDAASRTVHMKSSHVVKHYGCEVCGKKYGDRHNLRHHIEKYHSETDFECSMCEKRFFTRKSLHYHMNWHKPERQLRCRHSGCDRLFINQRHLKCHEATHTTGSRKSEYCGFCGKAFIHVKTLRWHIYRQHGGEKPFKCAICTEVFASYAEKRIHMLELHTENLTHQERSECMFQSCRQEFDNEKQLIHHMSVEHLQREPATPVIANNKRVLQRKRERQYTGLFQCSNCPQRFNMKSALERHMAVHSADRLHACTHCSKRYKRAQDLKWHMKTHDNEKPNVCDVCGKAFALKYVLTQHMRSHEVLEKNFKCETCGRAYLFEKSLRLHQRVHTGNTYYKCDLCQERFVTHIKFKTHMKKMHDTSQPHTKDSLDDFINIVIS